MTWGGLRGGVSIALALSLPSLGANAKQTILSITYAVVIFSILVQGLTLGKLIKYKMLKKSFRVLANK